MQPRSWIQTVGRCALAVTLLGSTFAAPALADDHDHDRGRPERRWDRRGDIRHFHERDFGRWRAGRWYHGRHGGRAGWWWIVGDAWYFYPAPVYPYPDPYVPPAVIATPAPPGPPPPGPSAPQYWYDCGSVKGFYPYVQSCPEGWMQVVPQAPPGG
jgi:hypothetical protein